jgi:hypothetical protein
MSSTLLHDWPGGAAENNPETKGDPEGMHAHIKHESIRIRIGDIFHHPFLQPVQALKAGGIPNEGFCWGACGACHQSCLVGEKSLHAVDKRQQVPETAQQL